MSNKLLALIRKLARDKEARTQLIKFLDDCPLTKEEHLFLYIVLIENRHRKNTCDKFNMQLTKYHTEVNEKLAKIENKFYREFFINYYRTIS